MIKFKTIITDKIITSIIYKHFKKSHPQFLIFNLIICLGGIFLIIWGMATIIVHIAHFHTGWGSYEYLMLFTIFMGLFFLWYSVIGVKISDVHKIRKHYLKDNQQSITIQYALDDTGIYINKLGNNAYYSWDNLIKIWEYSDYYIFEVEPNRYNLINKNSITKDNQNTLQTLLKSNLRQEQWA